MFLLSSRGVPALLPSDIPWLNGLLCGRFSGVLSSTGF